MHKQASWYVYRPMHMQTSWNAHTSHGIQETTDRSPDSTFLNAVVAAAIAAKPGSASLGGPAPPPPGARSAASLRATSFPPTVLRNTLASKPGESEKQEEGRHRNTLASKPDTLASKPGESEKPPNQAKVRSKGRAATAPQNFSTCTTRLNGWLTDRCGSGPRPAPCPLPSQRGRAGSRNSPASWPAPVEAAAPGSPWAPEAPESESPAPDETPRGLECSLGHIRGYPAAAACQATMPA